MLKEQGPAHVAPALALWGRRVPSRSLFLLFLLGRLGGADRGDRRPRWWITGRKRVLRGCIDNVALFVFVRVLPALFLLSGPVRLRGRFLLPYRHRMVLSEKEFER